MFTRENLEVLLDKTSIEGIHETTAAFYESNVDSQIPSFDILVDGVDVKECFLKLASDVTIRYYIKKNTIPPLKRLFNKIVNGDNTLYEISTHRVYDKIVIMSGTLFDKYDEIDDLRREDRFILDLPTYRNDFSSKVAGHRSDVDLLINLLILLFGNKIGPEDHINSVISMMIYAQVKDDETRSGIEIDLAKIIPLSVIVSGMNNGMRDGGKPIDMKREREEDSIMRGIFNLPNIDTKELEKFSLAPDIDIPIAALLSNANILDFHDVWPVIDQYDQVKTAILEFGCLSALEFMSIFGAQAFIDCGQGLLESGINHGEFRSIVYKGKDGFITIEQIQGVIGTQMPRSWLLTYLGI